MDDLREHDAFRGGYTPPAPPRPSLRPGPPAFGPNVTSAFDPWSQFSPKDLLHCYAMPFWVAQRLREFPQPVVGKGLTEPLSLPFTPDEVRTALLDVWKASHQRLNRNCANIDPASVRIALLVQAALQPRNQGWIDFAANRPVMTVGTPGSASGQGVMLRCMLYKLVGKPLPPQYDWCGVTPPAQSRIYNIRDVRTTFDAEMSRPEQGPHLPREWPLPPSVQMDRPGGERGGQPREIIGLDLEAAPIAPDPFTYNLFEVSSVFDLKE